MSYASRWLRLRSFFTSTTGRLALSYLAIIMGMSLGYSLVLYTASSGQLQRQLPPASLFQDEPNGNNGGRNFMQTPRLTDFFAERIAEARRIILMRLAILNFVTLVLGAALSYQLARRTLKPIEDSIEAQSQFVTDASHELRTPLTFLQTSNEVALRNPKLTVPQSKKLLADTIAEVGKLQALTNGLLKLATIGNEQCVTAPTSLQAVANDAMNGVVNAAQAKSISIEDSVPDLLVMADRQSLSQAIIILLDNAIKYSPPSTVVRLTGSQNGKQAVIQVHDQGPGIKPYDLSRIFDRFYRADQSRSIQHVEGYGIGLSLAQKLVQQQAGSIKASSTIGKGSDFTITLPLA